MTIADCFRIGSILKTRGLKGEMQMYVDFDGLESIKFNSIFLDMAGKLVPYFVSSLKYLQKNTAWLILEDVDTIEKASALVKRSVYLPNKLKPKQKKQEFTLTDLKGFTATDENEGELGIIADIHQYPKQLIAVVTYKNREVLFPLNEQIIKRVDIPNQIVTVDLPEGLLNIYLD